MQREFYFVVSCKHPSFSQDRALGRVKFNSFNIWEVLGPSFWSGPLRPGSAGVRPNLELCPADRSQDAGRSRLELGEKILPEIIPILEEGLRSPKSDERQGRCIGLSEIMKSTSRER